MIKNQQVSKFAGVVLAILFLAAACSPATPAPTAVPPSSTPLPATATKIPPTSTATPRPTPTANATATAQYNNLFDKVQEYKKAGYISTTAGSYQSAIDYSDSWAQINWYQWYPVRAKAADDFIVSTDIAWASASKTPNTSGCGFVFRIQSNGDHYIAYVDMNGYVYAAHNISNNWQLMGYGHYGKASTNGKANLVLIVEKSSFTVLVDGKFVKKFSGFDGKLASGDLAYTILSGTNKSFGTSCSFTNTVLWNLSGQ